MKSKPKRAVLVIEDAAGKRIRRLSLAEPYPESQDVYLTIEFDDQTQSLIEVGCVPSFRITQLARNSDGDIEPVKEAAGGTMRALGSKRR